MNAQISLFEAPSAFTEETLYEQESKGTVIPFPEQKEFSLTKQKKDGTPKQVVRNYRKSEEQSAWPIKDENDRKRIAVWLWENKDKKYFLAYMLGINLALRANELLSLKFSDVYRPDGEVISATDDFTDQSDRVRVHQSKNKKWRSIYLNQVCQAALKMCYPIGNPYSDRYLFESRQRDSVTGERKPISVDQLRKVLKEAANGCGIKYDVATHSLRKTWAYLHYQKYHDVDFLQAVLGHSSSATTLHYIGITAENEKRAYNSICVDPLGLCTGDFDFSSFSFLPSPVLLVEDTEPGGNLEAHSSESVQGTNK